jgi:hypothetical protein
VYNPPAVTIDLTKLTAGQIAGLSALATFVAALVAATSAFVVQFVKYWSDRRLALAAARRDYLVKEFGPFLTYITTRTKGMSTLAGVSFRHQAGTSTIDDLQTMIQGYVNSVELMDPTLFVSAQGSKKFIDALGEFNTTDTKIVEVLSMLHQDPTAVKPDKLAEVSRTMMIKAAIVRHEAEKYIFG